MKYFLYKITNTVNDKVYIGITGDPKRRKYEHLRKKSGSFSLVRLAVNKYGADNFTFEVLVEGHKQYITDLEPKAILLYESRLHGYNLQSGGSPDRGSKVKHRSDDKPVCAMGFWFPNNRVAIEALGINRKTFYKWRKEGTLHLEARQLKAVERPERGSKEDTANRSVSMQGKNSGADNGMFGRKNTSRSRPVLIEGALYESITEAVGQTQYTKSQIEKRIKKGAEGFQYAPP